MINKTAAIIAGAGAGNRLGANLPKALVKLVDKTLVEHAVSSLAPVAQLLIVTAPAGFEEEFRKVLGDQVTVITGGILRSDSIRLALAQIPNNYEYVLVHDAARALATTTLAKSVVEQLVKGEQAVIPALDVIDSTNTVKARFQAGNTSAVFGSASDHSVAFIQGASENTRMTITTDGHITIPNQPSFRAYKTASNTGGGLDWNGTYHNVGSHFNVNNGKFTAPIAVYYFISMHYLTDNNINNF